jgi:hypothetical protein
VYSCGVGPPDVGATRGPLAAPYSTRAGALINDEIDGELERISDLLTQSAARLHEETKAPRMKREHVGAEANTIESVAADLRRLRAEA